MNKVLLWVWRVVIGTFVLALIPLSLWYLIGAISTVDYRDHVSNSLPLPFVPELVSAPVGLVLMTWGMVALWWLVLNHERLSLRQIGLPWWIGLIGGTSIAVYWLIRLSASNGENDEFVFVPPLIFVIALEVILLVRMCFNSARTPLRPSTSDVLEN
jgi:hypothetical protein